MPPLKRIPDNWLLDTDGYKPSHWAMEPEGLERMDSYFESRGGEYPVCALVGLQVSLIDYFTSRLTEANMEEAEAFMAAYFNSNRVFNAKGFRHVVHDLGGRLPLEVWAVPEALPMGTHNVLFRHFNTHPSPLTSWVTNYAEPLLAHVWSASTTFIKSWLFMRAVVKNLLETGETDDLASAPFRVHDFGFRGSHSYEAAGRNGFAHLAAGFMGSDTILAGRIARHYYGDASPSYAMASIPASEHGVMTAHPDERAAIRRILEAYPDGAVAIVSDTYNLYECVDQLYGVEFKDTIEGRNGVLVVRPDSGEPPVVVRQVVEKLAAKFGTRTNSRGFLTLAGKVGVIQGDGIDHVTVQNIYAALRERKFSASIPFFGCGGFLHAKHDRDTQKFAIKACRVVVDGVARDIRKTPVTDNGKWSKKGIYGVQRNTITKAIESVPADELVAPNLLQPVYRDGELLKEWTLTELREHAKVDPESLYQ